MKKRKRDAILFDVGCPLGNNAISTCGILDANSCDNLLATTPLLKISAQIDIVCSKYKQLDCSTRLIVLIATGSFNPPHLMHVKMLESARKAMSSQLDTFVVGGFLCPSHDKYVQGKLTEEEAFNSFHRCALCEVATQDSDWISVNRCEYF